MQFQVQKSKKSSTPVFRHLNGNLPYIKLLLICFIAFGTLNLSAQCRTQLPEWEIRLGVGLLPTFLKDHSTSELQPVSLEIRHLINRKFSLGLLAGNSISSATQEYHTGEARRVRNDFRMLALRGAVHSQAFKNWDVYGGIILGYSHSDVSYHNVDPGKSYETDLFPQARQRNGLFFSAFVGAQYQIWKQMNVFGELGYGLSLATVGTALRF